jgi:hypothetical protein
VAAVKVPPEQWQAFLTEACADDEDLSSQVSELLQERQQAGSFLDQPADRGDPERGQAAVRAPQRNQTREPSNFTVATISDRLGQAHEARKWMDKAAQ